MPDLKNPTGAKSGGTTAKCLGWATFALLSALACAGTARAHGVELIKEDRPTVQVRASYSDGGPMNYAEVSIYAPDDSQRAFQRGRTDRLGRFAFCPQQKGSWRVIISDGMGHQIDEKIEVGKAPGAAPSVAPQAAGLPMAYKVLVGLSLIFGLFGLASIVLAHRKAPGGNPAPPKEDKVP